MSKPQPRFQRYIGIDYSGAETPTASLKGLRVYMTDRNSTPGEVHPPASPRKYWTRQGMAQWLVDGLTDKIPSIIGIDHGFSFPIQYFERHKLAHDWPAFLEDFCRHWPADQPYKYVDSLRDGNPRTGNSRWRRLTEMPCGAKSVFHFDVTGSVAKSTHSGIPWLRFIRNQAGDWVHFWPFDGWQIPDGKSVVAEVYPALWNQNFPREDRDPHQHDAFCVAETLRRADRDGTIHTFFKPNLNERQIRTASVEGWILGLAAPSPSAISRVTGCPFCERSESVEVIARNEFAAAFPESRCFYCQERIREPKQSHVDHFIPWSRYQENGLSNLVIADAKCNGNKSDFLAAVEHVERWLHRFSNASPVSSDLETLAGRIQWDLSVQQ